VLKCQVNLVCAEYHRRDVILNRKIKEFIVVRSAGNSADAIGPSEPEVALGAAVFFLRA
jgi:hypothetical protein